MNKEYDMVKDGEDVSIGRNGGKPPAVANVESAKEIYMALETGVEKGECVGSVNV